MSRFEAPEMTLRDYWSVVIHRKWLIAIAVLATVAPAIGLSLAQKPIYVADAQMLLQSRPGESLFGNDFVFTADADRLVQNEIAVLEGDIVYSQVITDLALTQDPPFVTGSADASNDVVTASVESNDPDTAAILANAYIEAYRKVKRSQAVDGLALASAELQTKVSALQAQIDELDARITTATPDEKTLLDGQRKRLADQQAVFRQRIDQVQVDSALTTGGAQLIAPAEVPTDPVAPTPTRTAALAIVVGLLLGLGAAFFVDYLDDSIRSPDDIAKLGTGLPLLAVVPTDPPPDYRPVALSRPDDRAVEAYRALRTNVAFLGFERNMQVIEITSAVPGEGKTTTASNLAVVLAQTGVKVVLIDADLRRPMVQRVFGLSRSRGLTDNLVGEPLDLTLSRLDDHLSVIGSGAVPPNPSEMLSGQRMKAFLDDLRTQFDYIIIDSAPTLPVSDAVALSRHVDGVLVVAQAGRTSAGNIRQMLANLEQVSAPVIGVVLNRARQNRRGDTAYGYGYGYGGSYGNPVAAKQADD